MKVILGIATAIGALFFLGVFYPSIFSPLLPLHFAEGPFVPFFSGLVGACLLVYVIIKKMLRPINGAKLAMALAIPLIVIPVGMLAVWAIGFSNKLQPLGLFALWMIVGLINSVIMVLAIKFFFRDKSYKNIIWASVSAIVASFLLLSGIIVVMLTVHIVRDNQRYEQRMKSFEAKKSVRHG